MLQIVAMRSQGGDNRADSILGSTPEVTECSYATLEALAGEVKANRVAVEQWGNMQLIWLNCHPVCT